MARDGYATQAGRASPRCIAMVTGNSNCYRHSYHNNKENVNTRSFEVLLQILMQEVKRFKIGC